MKKYSIIKVLLENEKLLIHGPSMDPKKTIRKCNFKNEIPPEPEFISPNKYAKQTTLNTDVLITKNRFEVLCESDEEDCNKSVSTSVKLLKQKPNDDLNRAKKNNRYYF